MDKVNKGQSLPCFLRRLLEDIKDWKDCERSPGLSPYSLRLFPTPERKARKERKFGIIVELKG